MKKTALLFATALTALTAQAQLNGDGYYRAQNVTTERYIRIVDNTGWVDVSAQTADLGAIKTRKPLSRVISDAGSVIYIKKMSEGYDFQSQGTGSVEISKYQLRLWNNGNSTYQLYATKSGLTKYLNDEYGSAEDGEVGFQDDRTRNWYIHPISASGDNYFGLEPELNIDGTYYQTFFASFPFSFASTGMKAYYIIKVDATWGVAVMQEVTGDVPASTPVIIQCASASASDNRLNLLSSTPSALAGNKMEGVCFSYYTTSQTDKQHNNFVAYDPATMRVLGKLSDGSLGFVKSNIERIPANSCWITVPVSTPDEIRIIDPDTYNAELAKPITVKVDAATRKYGDANPAFTYTVEGEGQLRGEPTITTTATVASPVGTYDIQASKGNISNTNVTFVNNVLTVEKTPMNVYAFSYTINLYEDIPELGFEYDASCWRNNENEVVFDKLVTASTTATPASPVGVYDITLSGGEAQNYEFFYYNGTLTIVDPTGQGVQSVKITQPVDVYNIYGMKVRSQVRSLDELPRGLYIINGKKVQVH